MVSRRERCHISLRRDELEKLTTAELVWTAGATGHLFADFSAVTRTDIINVLSRTTPHLTVAELWAPDGNLALKDRKWLGSHMALAKVMTDDYAPVTSGLSPTFYLFVGNLASFVSFMLAYMLFGSVYIAALWPIVAMLCTAVFIHKKEGARWQKNPRR